MSATHFSGPVVSTAGFQNGSGSVNTVAAATTLTSENNGQVIIMDAAAGATITLPALADGLRFKFVVGSTFITTNWIVASAEGDNINGIIASMGATVAGVPAVGEDQINFVATAEAVGDYIELVADAGNSQWLVSGVCATDGGITATDPA